MNENTPNIAAESNAAIAYDQDPRQPGTLVPITGPGGELPATTPAQARVEAVGATLARAYERASTLELTKEESDALTAPFPDEAFRPGADGKEELLYIEHATLRERLNAVLGVGRWSLITRRTWAEEYVTRKNEPATRIYVEAVLVVRGCFAAEAIGDMTYYPKNASQNYGDAVEGAKSAALRRCAKELGIGLQVWHKDFCEGWMRRKLEAEEAGREAKRQEYAKQYGTERPAATRSNAPQSSVEASQAPEPPPIDIPATPPPPTRQMTFQHYTLLLDTAKAKFIKGLSPIISAAETYFENAGLILPSEPLDSINAQSLFPSASPMMSKEAVIEAIKADYDRHMGALKTAIDGDSNQLPGAEVPESSSFDGPAEPVEQSVEQKPQRSSARTDTEAPVSERVVLVKGTNTKRGKSPKGPWVKYGFIDENGDWYNSFDAKIGKAAEMLKGKRVRVSYTEDRFGKTIVYLTPYVTTN